jgi:SARP family transcriptional regulator, regulator of embCAB operon
MHITGEVAAHLLGGFRISVQGTPIDIALRRRVRDVLAYLLTHRRVPVPRDVLMEAIWPRARPDPARNSLHVALSGARQAMRVASTMPVIERYHDSYRIAPAFDVWTDVEQFERECTAGRRAEIAGEPAALRHYETACQLYEGDFLADDPYSEWAAGRREELRLSAIDAQSRLLDAYVERGSFAAAAALARRIVDDDPCNEHVHRQLMVCYSATALRHMALFQYHRLADELWTTFRARPSAQTQRLYELLRRQDAVPTSVDLSLLCA